MEEQYTPPTPLTPEEQAEARGMIGVGDFDPRKETNRISFEAWEREIDEGVDEEVDGEASDE